MTLAIVVLLAAFADAPDDPAEAFTAARAVIEQQEAAIRSFDVTYSLENKRYEIGQSSSDKPRIQRQAVREQRRGDRFRRIFDLIYNPDLSEEPERDLNTFDGSTFFYYSEVGESGSKSSEGSEPTCIAQSLSMSNVGLGDLLARHKDAAEADWEEIGDARLLAVRWHDNNELTRTYYLDPAAAWQPRRFTLEYEYPDGAYADGRKRHKDLGVVQEYVRQEGFIWPKVLRVTRNIVDSNGREWCDLENLLTIKSVAFNVELDDSLFTIDFPMGTRVNDVDRGVIYVVGEPDSERTSTAVTYDPSAAAPIPGPPYELWADWRLWLCAAAVFAGLIVWLKRQGTA